jgi:hypothetical protein
MTNDYTASTDCFDEIIEGNYSSSDYPQMGTMVTAASRLIDREMGRWDGFFYPTTDDVTRYYDGSGLTEQDIDEFATITTISVSEQGLTASTGYTDWAATDYLVFPYNRTPITKLIVDDNGTKPAWYMYRKAVKVVGVAGYSLTVPDVVAQACKMQAVRWFMRAKQGYGDTGASVDIGGITLKGQTQLDPDVKALLFPLKLELSK